MTSKKIVTQTTTFGLKGYLKPTPRLFRRIGTSFLSIFMMAGVFTTMLHASQTLVYVFALIGILGKFLTTFFGEDEAVLEIEGLKTVVESRPSKAPKDSD